MPVTPHAHGPPRDKKIARRAQGGEKIAKKRNFLLWNFLSSRRRQV